MELIRSDERYTFEPGPGRKIFFRRLGGAERQRIIQHNTKRGFTDWSGVDLEVARACVLGWEGYTRDGEPVTFSPELVELLPEADRGPVVALILEGDVGGRCDPLPKT